MRINGVIAAGVDSTGGTSRPERGFDQLPNLPIFSQFTVEGGCANSQHSRRYFSIPVGSGDCRQDCLAFQFSHRNHFSESIGIKESAENLRLGTISVKFRVLAELRAGQEERCISYAMGGFLIW